MKRYHRLDELRGLVFFSMALYHAMWDQVYMFGAEVRWYMSGTGYIWQQSICWSFILLSGFCWHFGRKKYRHAWIVFGAGLLVTLFTCLFLPQERVVFGVLTFIGTAAFLTTASRPLLSRCRPAVGMAGSTILFILTRNVNQGCLGFEKWQWLLLPDRWYRNLFTTFLGFPAENFYSADYFSLFPWLFLYLAGYFLYRCMTEKPWSGTEEYSKRVPAALPRFLERGHIPVLQWVGRRSLLLYLLHQPVIYVLLLIVNRMF